MMQVGMTADQIKNCSTTDQIDWQRELCWQVAKLREDFGELSVPLDRALTSDHGHYALRVVKS
jgi:hypothetical protein